MIKVVPMHVPLIHFSVYLRPSLFLCDAYAELRCTYTVNLYDAIC